MSYGITINLTRTVHRVEVTRGGRKAFLIERHPAMIVNINRHSFGGGSHAQPTDLLALYTLAKS